MRAGILIGAGLGAGLMYLLDPDRGRRRRVVLRDQARSTARRAGRRMNVVARDFSHRAAGLAAKTRHALETERPADDVLAARVRAALGRVVSHPHAIRVTAAAGRVTLSGPILAREVPALLACAAAVRGVTGIENRLTAHPQAGRLADLQGGRVFRPAGVRWSPATRMLACGIGTGLMTNCLMRRTLGAATLGTVGFGLFVRGLTNLDLGRMAGLDRGRRWLEVRKVVTVHAPVADVYDFWTHVPNFPRFMAHLRAVRDLGGGRSHWVAAGPAGVAASWTSTITRAVPNELIAWRTEPGSTIPNAGVVRFQPDGGGTRVDIRLAYRPPAGPLGHLAARLFGADPKSALDDDLVRLKSLLEAGRASAPGKRATRDELVGAATHNGPPAVTPTNRGSRGQPAARVR